MKLARAFVLVSLLCLAALGWVRPSDPPTDPGTQPIIIYHQHDGAAALNPTAFADNTKKYTVRARAPKQGWTDGTRVFASAKAFGPYASRVRVTTVEVLMSLKGDVYKGKEALIIEPLGGGAAINNQDVDLEVTLTRKDQNGTVIGEVKENAVVTLDFPASFGESKGMPKPVLGSAPREGGTQPIIIKPDPIANPPQFPVTAGTWSLSADIAAQSLNSGTLVFTAEPGSSVPTDELGQSRLRFKPAIIYDVPTDSTPNPDVKSCDISVAFYTVKGKTAVKGNFPITGTLTLYAADGTVIFRAVQTKTLNLNFPKQ